jgi:hypothetical protein
MKKYLIEKLKALRPLFFSRMFSEEEQTAIINALYRRADDLSTNNIQGDERLRTICRDIAMEMMR